jgi:hypothetical protein
MGRFTFITSVNRADRQSARKGFALIVVLFSLTVLTLIFGTASLRTLTHIEGVQLSERIAAAEHETTRRADLLLQLGPSVLDPDQTIEALGEISVQPVTGLIDLNTASPALLETLLKGYGLADSTVSDALSDYRTWRREGRVFLRVADFYRVTGLSQQQVPEIERFATVFSGRIGIAADQAPLTLLEHLTGSPGRREALLEELDPRFFSPGSMVNLRLNGPYGATIHLGGNSVTSRRLR